jgi:putative NADH-flavin reductase
MSESEQDASAKPIIGVIGATGAQGGGLVKAALEDSESPFKIRAFTRDTSKVRRACEECLQSIDVQGSADDVGMVLW